MLKLGLCRDGGPSRKRGPGVEKNSRVKSPQAWAVQGRVTPWEGGLGEKNFRVKGCLDSGCPGIGDLLGEKKRVLILVDQRFWVIILYNFKKDQFDCLN